MLFLSQVLLVTSVAPRLPNFLKAVTPYAPSCAITLKLRFGPTAVSSL